ncbi:hypothetical protein L6452_40243 [Arctium lappa]|uniref:Uncharacterized protein n=1 Tax=Arctium lappa TaxID=4217 RepID=A0ACB8XMK0_ARCLA|nr:hypothetical protein L6452_40243 [Arctium lappa]
MQSFLSYCSGFLSLLMTDSIAKDSSYFHFRSLAVLLSIFKSASGSWRSSVFQIKASEDASADPNELFNDLKEKWDALENKSTVIVYGGGAVVAIWLSSVVVATKDLGVGRTWIYRMVCLPISSVQVEQKKVGNRYGVHKEEDCRDRVDGYYENAQVSVILIPNSSRQNRMSSMERSESPRNTAGSAIGIRQNGWRALDQLGVAEILRHTAISINQRDQPNLVDLNPSCPPVLVMSQLIMSLVVEVHQGAYPISAYPILIVPDEHCKNRESYPVRVMTRTERVYPEIRVEIGVVQKVKLERFDITRSDAVVLNAASSDLDRAAFSDLNRWTAHLSYTCCNGTFQRPLCAREGSCSWEGQVVATVFGVILRSISLILQGAATVVFVVDCVV